MDKIELKVIIFPAPGDSEEKLAAEIISHLGTDDRNILIIPAQQEYNSLLEWIDNNIKHFEDTADREDRKMEPNLSYRGQQYAFEAVKEKLISLNTK
jgi:hypothetical protein